jgi:hypothetical protein
MSDTRIPQESPGPLFTAGWTACYDYHAEELNAFRDIKEMLQTFFDEAAELTRIENDIEVDVPEKSEAELWEILQALDLLVA